MIRGMKRCIFLFFFIFYLFALAAPEPLLAVTDTLWLPDAVISSTSTPTAEAHNIIAQTDTDNDGLFDALEQLFHTDMEKKDTDGDGYDDFNEVIHGYDPIGVSSTAKLIRRIVVDRTTQELRLEVSGISVFVAPVSTGILSRQTPSGTFRIQQLVPVMRYVGRDYNLPGVKWNMQFKQNYFLHTAYWHNDFGKRAHSSGCVNMREVDAKFLYHIVSVGLPVVITGQTPRGNVKVPNT